VIAEPYVSTVLFGLSILAIAYFLVINGTYLTLTVFAITHIRQRTERESYEPAGILQSNQFLPGIAIVVPAYNEEKVIVDSVTSLLSLEYPFHEVIVVNDGSSDETVGRLVSEFELERIDAEFPVELPCEPVDEIYRASDTDLVVIDKANGGKADALNAGLFFTEKPLFCAIDADSLIERGALQAIVEPFLSKPTTTVATGGTVRIANGVSFEKGAPDDVALSTNRLVRFQAVEYLRAFFLGRTGLSRIRSLIIISGAFGLFDAETLREIGGYDTDSITEDMELVVRLHRHLIETDQEYEVTFLPHPVVWTEVPESLSVLSRQRRRWFRGLLDTLIKHRSAIGRPSYGLVGLVALPLFLFVEGIGRLVEGLGYVSVPVLFVIGILDVWFFIAFLFVSVGLGAILSTVAILGEVLTYRRYDEPKDVAVLLGYALLESFSYRPWRAFVSWRATFEFLLGDKSWGKMTRSGFEETTDASE
jgi:cellulose synthase/poly-beta-1,6-N-acetylglucosamine synthase-like glycosyltransferase